MVSPLTVLRGALGDNNERFKIVSGLWLFHTGRGEVHRAFEFSDELFRLAEQRNDDDLRLQGGHAVHYGIFYHQFRRDPAAVIPLSDRLAELAADQHLVQHQPTAIFARGWVLLNQGQAKGSISELRRALDACMAPALVGRIGLTTVGRFA